GPAKSPDTRVIRDCLEGLRELAPHTFRKTVARIAGVSVIHAYFRPRMDDDSAARAIATGTLYELLQDLLDDLLDGGGWTFAEALRLYERCLRPLTTTRASMRDLEQKLADVMGPGQDGLEHILTMTIRELRSLTAGRDPRVRDMIAAGQIALGRAQAATVHLRRESFDRVSLEDVASTLPTPDPGLAWLDRLAISASWPSTIALFDASFTTDPVPTQELEAHAQAWLFFDEAVSFLEHFAGADPDAREGTLNVASLHANLPPTILDETSFPGFTADQRRSIFEKATDCLVRAIREGMAGGGRPEDYAFLAIMIPTIIFAMCRTPPDQANAFMALLAPAVREVIITGSRA
ncbi:MAG: hypothetical protein L3J78_05005, partial [Thermoplasmata archaeon]|nr:hypothetical protein [Thermoplasmata archaeon]